MYRVIILLFLLMSLFACKSPSDDAAVAEMHRQVMEVHDEVMPKMGDIYKTKKRLKALLTEHIESADSTRSNLLIAIKNLEDADDGMMQWMSDFKSGYKGKTDQETIAYLKSEKDKISQVSLDMKTAIANGQKLINQ